MKLLMNVMDGLAIIKEIGAFLILQETVELIIISVVIILGFKMILEEVAMTLVTLLLKLLEKFYFKIYL